MKPASRADTMVKTMMIAIVIAIGPIEFSTSAENMNAIDATVPMLKMPNP